MFWHRTNKPGFLVAMALLPALVWPGISVAQSGVDCYSVGSRVAAQNGGTLVQATAESRGGQTVCRVVVVIPGGSGERPKRAEFVVPAK
ncbi:hypothetical protein [uncultured Nitratireductor sp.]|uniref:hypothetical protein n=1 Tax=uncultured Nitratireductor sp. TaxID=520953 RepID=UPI0025EA633B|nr:hypothetical protein [uncultured Nitratireductor sp.]